jgi:hypothetical protein
MVRGMIIETNREIKEGTVIIPKGTRGIVKGIQWGDKKDSYVVDFSQLSLVYVFRQDIIILAEEKVVEKKSKKTHSSYEKDET